MTTTMPGVARNANRSMLSSAARGAGLIGAAVILGIILLQVVDDGSSGPAGNGGNGGDTPVDTTGANGTETTVPADTRPPAEVSTLVLNASEVAGAAGTLTNQLVAAGYTTLPAADDPVTRMGIGVACREGFEGDANALALAVSSATGSQATPEAFPTDREADLGLQDADCVVFLGQV
ncbi:MAG: LytR C-terminal domain-containing protein [Acidimicrobiia bacterium]